MGISLSGKEQKKIAKAAAFSTMKEVSPAHLQKGKFGKWVGKLSASQKRMAVERAGKLMHMLNYPMEAEQYILPTVPEVLPKKN